MPKHPLCVTIVAWIYIVTGIVGFAFHLSDFNKSRPFDFDFLCIEIVRIAAVIAGVFLLRGHNWARWLALAWILFHVVIGFLNSATQGVVHVVFAAIIAACLFHPAANRYFASPPSAR